MKVRTVVPGLLLVAASLSAQVTETQFWDTLAQGKLDTAASEAVDIGRQNSIYDLYAAILYSMQQDYRRFQIYSFEYNRRPHRDGDLQAENGKIASSTGSAMVLAFLGVVDWETGKREQAIPLLGRALEIDPHNPFALNYYSMQFYQKDDRKYLSYSLEALKYRKTYSEAYNNAAVAYLGLGEPEKAKELLEQCIRMSPSPHPNTYNNLINILGKEGVGIKSRRGDYTVEGDVQLSDAALESLHQLLKSYPSAYDGMLEFMVQRAMYYPAQFLLQKVRQDHVPVPVAYYMALITYLTNHDSDSRKFARDALKNDNLTYRQIDTLAGNFFQAKDFPTAIEFYQAALAKLDPEDTLYGMRINADLGTALLIDGKSAQGVPYLDKALTFDPNDTITLMNLGKYFHDSGDDVKAKEYLERAAKSTDDERYLSYIHSLMK